MTSTIDAFHLPGLLDADVIEWRTREVPDAAVRLRYPRLSPDGLARLIRSIRIAKSDYLADRRLGDIVAAIDSAASRLADRSSPERELAEGVLPGITGYSPEMVRLMLDRMAADWLAPRLRELLRSEFSDPGVLESFRPQAAPGGGPHRRAFGPELAFHVFAGNVPGVAVTSMIRCLLVRGALLAKTAFGEPLLPALFARTLAGVDPGLGECVAVTYWEGGDTALEEVALAACDLVVVFGAAEAIASVRGRTPPGVRLVEHGPRASLGLIGRDALGARELDPLVEDVALAVATFDQQGCVSPHVVYVERGGEVAPAVFAGLLGERLARMERELPRGHLSVEEAGRIHEVRGAAEFGELAGREISVFASEGTEWTVIYDADPAFTLSCLNRLVWVKPVDALEEVAELVEPFGRVLQTVGVAGAKGRLAGLAELLGRSGVSRVTDFRRMPWPPPAWHHDGAEPLRELVRWTELED